MLPGFQSETIVLYAFEILDYEDSPLKKCFLESIRPLTMPPNNLIAKALCSLLIGTLVYSEVASECDRKLVHCNRL